MQESFPDVRAAGQSYFKKTGLFPIMHAVAIRTDVIDAEAKRLAYANWGTTTSLKVTLSWVTQVKAFSPEKLDRFLVAAWDSEPAFLIVSLTLTRTGLRLGEARALQLPGIDLANREIHVICGLSAGRIESPKSGHGRAVDMSFQLSNQSRRAAYSQPGPTPEHADRQARSPNCL